MVPNWIRSLAESWGHEMRKFEAKLGNVQGTMGRIKEEGEGASIRSYSDHLPNIDFPEEVQKFHRAWLDLDYQYRNIIVIGFQKRGPAIKKYRKMGMKRWKYYKTLNTALIQIAVDWHLYE